MLVNILIIWQDMRHYFSPDQLLLRLSPIITIRVNNFSFEHFLHWRYVSWADITTILLTLPVLFPPSNELLSNHFIVEKGGWYKTSYDQEWWQDHDGHWMIDVVRSGVGFWLAALLLLLSVSSVLLLLLLCFPDCAAAQNHWGCHNVTQPWFQD